MRRLAPTPRAAALTAAMWLTLIPLVAAAQELRVPSAAIVTPTGAAPVPAPQLPAPIVTLNDAVRLTLQHDPEAALGREEISRARGRVRETRGMFDSKVNAKTTF